MNPKLLHRFSKPSDLEPHLKTFEIVTDLYRLDVWPNFGSNLVYLHDYILVLSVGK